MIIHLLPEIDKAVWDKASVNDVKKQGKGQRGRHHKNSTIPDETIVVMRRMHEIDRKTIRQVQQAYPDISQHYVRDILNYQTRCNLRLGSKT